MGRRGSARLPLCYHTDGELTTPWVRNFPLLRKLLCRFWPDTHRLTRHRGASTLSRLRGLRTGSARLVTDSVVAHLGEPCARTPLIPTKYR
jgi:hypothetical protein